MTLQSIAAVFTGEGGTTTTNNIMKIASGVFAVALTVTFVNLFMQGHAAFNTGNYGITWGLPIITYLYLVLTATGLTFVGSLAMIFGFNDFYPVVKRCVWLSIAMLVSGFTVLALEIGHPFRMWWAMPAGLQYVSPMFWMGIFYTLYLVLLGLKFWRIHAGDWHSSMSWYLGVASFISVVIAHSTLGLVFGMMAMRPLWYDGMMPVYFLVIAAAGGAAFAVFFTYLPYGFRQDAMSPALRTMANGTTLPKIFATIIGLTIMMLVDRTVTALWTNQEGFQVYEEMVRSPLNQFALWVGLVLPFVLMLAPRFQRQERWQVLSAVLVAFSLFVGLYGYVIGGQRVPMFKGTWIPDLIEYTPSFTEWTITITGFALVFLIYAVGEKMFRLAECPGCEHGETLCHPPK